MNTAIRTFLMGGQESSGSDASEPKTPPTLPTPVQVLLDAAIPAARSLDRFVQLHDPRGSDLKALENLRAALAQFESGGAA